MGKKDNRDIFKNISLITQIGLSMIMPIIIGVYVGGFIDQKVGTQMVFRLIFILLGVAAAFLNLFKLTK
ncbi:MAG: AtpZ/AtpI family protein [Tissierellia bacterium]|nr:AtpZ/AtpI family protein [Tissierellia bacterium]